MMTERRFPPPWDIEEYDQGCFIVRDNNGQALSYVYYKTADSLDKKVNASSSSVALG